MCVCVCVLFEFRQFVFRLRISKFCVDLCKKKKSDRTRCLAVSILEYNLGGTILTGIRSRQSKRKRFGFLKEERNSVMIHRWFETSEHRTPGLSNSLNQWTFMTCK